MNQIIRIVFFLFPALKQGADPQQIQLILKYRLILDNRKQINTTSTKDQNYTLWLQYLLYLFFGALSAVVLGIGGSSFSSLFLVYTFLLVMLTLNLVADFSTVMLDTRDNTIILPRPVSERTYLLSRIFHVSFYILGFSASFSIIPAIVVLVKFGLAATAVFFFNVLLSSILAVFVTHLLYLGLMKFVNGERFKDIISYFQIFITIMIMGGYQVIVQSIGAIKSLTFGAGAWWMFLVPSAWMAGSNEAFVSFHFSTFSWISILLSIIVPLAGLWMVVRVLAPGFNQKLASLDQGDLKKNSWRRKADISRLLASIFTRTDKESALFSIIWKIAGRDRKFKQTIYPMLGSLVVFFGIMFYTQFKHIGHDNNSKFYLLLLYFPVFYLFILITSLKYSDNYRSAWIYKSIPINQPGEIVSATIKAISLKLFVPLYLFCNGVLLYYKGIGFSFEILSALLINFIFLTGLLFLFKFDLPFTTDSRNKVGDSNMLLAIAILPVSAVMAGVHYLFVKLNFNFLLVTVVLFVLCCLSFRKIRKAGWNKISVFEV